jgi:hypothetical protein
LKRWGGGSRRDAVSNPGNIFFFVFSVATIFSLSQGTSISVTSVLVADAEVAAFLA